MALQIIIDSASDVTPEEARAENIVRLPMRIIFGEEEYLDCVTLSQSEFYEKLLESDTMPTTCQVPPSQFEEAFRKAVENGDEVLAITVSGKLSGTYQSAVIAAEEFPDRVWVVDSENVCIGERLLIERAVTLRAEGLSARETAERLDKEKKQVRILAMLDTLEYLKRGGRISATAAFAAGVLSIKPVATVEDGLVAIAGKARGSKQMNNLVRQLVEKSGGIDFSRPVWLAYSGLSDAVLQKYVRDNSDLWQSHRDSLPVSMIGSTIGTHVGPNAVAVAFFAP